MSEREQQLDRSNRLHQRRLAKARERIRELERMLREAMAALEART